MHPILGDRRRLATYVLAWLLVGMLLALGVRRDTLWLDAALFVVPLTLAYAFVALSSWYVCRAFPLRGGTVSIWNVLVVQALAAAFASTLWVGAAAPWAVVVDWARGSVEAETLYVEQLPILFVVGALLFSLTAAFHYLIIAVEHSQEVETRVLESAVLARDAELKAIRAQIDPHFIFNSLHSVSALTTIDPAAARRMCLLLADFLRDTLRLGASARIPFADELALAERFLAIEQVRLGDRLHIEREVDPGALTCPVPPLLLQPLVENAVVHGVAQLVDGGTIRLMARQGENGVTIVVENPCDPERRRSRGTGLGLDLLRQRLQALGAEDAVRAVERDGVFRVEVRVPGETGDRR